MLIELLQCVCVYVRARASARGIVSWAHPAVNKCLQKTLFIYPCLVGYRSTFPLDCNPRKLAYLTAVNKSLQDLCSVLFIAKGVLKQSVPHTIYIKVGSNIHVYAGVYFVYV